MFPLDEEEVLGAVGFLEFCLAVDRRVILAEDAPDELLVFGCDVLERQLGFYLLEFGNHFLIDLELLLPVGALVQKLDILAQVLEGEESGHVEGWVDADAQMPVLQLGVHAAHRCADDEVRLLFLNHFRNEGNGFGGRNWNVGRDHGDAVIGIEVIAEICCCPRRAGGRETVQI